MQVPKKKFSNWKNNLKCWKKEKCKIKNQNQSNRIGNHKNLFKMNQQLKDNKNGVKNNKLSSFNNNN